MASLGPRRQRGGRLRFPSFSWRCSSRRHPCSTRSAPVAAAEPAVRRPTSTGGADRSRRLLGIADHRRLKVPHGHARQGRVRRDAAERRGAQAGRELGSAKDEAAGEQCRAYGAGGIMRLPGRLRISWQDDTTLKVETDTGTQTRLLASRPARSSRGHMARPFRCAVEHRGSQPQGRHDESACGLRAQERRAIQRAGDGHRAGI